MEKTTTPLQHLSILQCLTNAQKSLDVIFIKYWCWNDKLLLVSVYIGFKWIVLLKKNL